MGQGTSVATKDAGKRTSGLRAKLVGGLVWSLASIALFTPWFRHAPCPMPGGCDGPLTKTFGWEFQGHSRLGFLSSQGSSASPSGGPSSRSCSALSVVGRRSWQARTVLPSCTLLDAGFDAYPQASGRVSALKGAHIPDHATDLGFRSFCLSGTGNPSSRSDRLHIGQRRGPPIQDLRT